MSTTDETITESMVELKDSAPTPQRQHSDVTIPAEVSDTAGLAIAPRLAWQRGRLQFTGEWELRHVASGRLVVPCLDMGLGQARDAAGLVGEFDVDWTQPREVVEAFPFGPLHDVFLQIEQASKEARPARMCSSWQQLDRGWFIYDLDTDTRADEAAEHRFATVADAEAEWRCLETTGRSTRYEIRREDREPWALRCTWVDCPELLNVYERPAHPDPVWVVEFAEADGWRQVDEQHWLCPTCSHLFTTIHQL